MKKISYRNLYNFVENILSEVGLDKFSTESVTLGLCESSLRGVDSHGVRLLPHYVNSALHGRKNTSPNFETETAPIPYFSAIPIQQSIAFIPAACPKALSASR